MPLSPRCMTIRANVIAHLARSTGRFSFDLSAPVTAGPSLAVEARPPSRLKRPTPRRRYMGRCAGLDQSRTRSAFGSDELRRESRIRSVVRSDLPGGRLHAGLGNLIMCHLMCAVDLQDITRRIHYAAVTATSTRLQSLLASSSTSAMHQQRSPSWTLTTITGTVRRFAWVRCLLRNHRTDEVSVGRHQQDFLQRLVGSLRQFARLAGLPLSVGSRTAALILFC